MLCTSFCIRGCVPSFATTSRQEIVQTERPLQIQKKGNADRWQFRGLCCSGMIRRSGGKARSPYLMASKALWVKLTARCLTRFACVHEDGECQRPCRSLERPLRCDDILRWPLLAERAGARLQEVRPAVWLLDHGNRVVFPS